MTEEKDEIVLVGDLRHEENMAGAIDIQIDSELMSIKTGGANIHRLLIFREEDARKLYSQLSNLFGRDLSRYVAANRVTEEYHYYNTPAGGPLCGRYSSIGSMPEKVSLVRKKPAEKLGIEECPECSRIKDGEN